MLVLGTHITHIFDELHSDDIKEGDKDYSLVLTFLSQLFDRMSNDAGMIR